MLSDQRENLKKKQRQFSVIVSVLFVLIILRFFYLQVYKQAQYLKASENNRNREIVLKPTRGLILDRNGAILVDNHPSYSVYAIPFEVLKADSVLQLTSHILNIDIDEIKDIINKKRSGYFTPVKIKRYINFETLSKIEEYKLDLPGISIQIEPRRYYPSGIKASHLFGFLGEVTRGELKRGSYRGAKQGDIVGKKGLEKVYDKELRGEPGYRYIEVDVLGREVRKLEDKPEILPVPGKNLHLTIDAQLQRFIEARMDTMRGGAIVVNCTNGEVLAIVSKPDYNLEIFSKPLSTEVWDQLINDEDKPLFDRMVQSLYPPGSTFKLVLAAAALEKGIISPEWKNYCPGYYRLGNKVFDCWKKEGHGELDLLDAIEQSCNVYFYQLGLKVGLDNWAEFAKRFLFDKPTNIDLVSEEYGTVPDREFLNHKYGKNKWSKGLLLNSVIGQGDVLVTPLQMVRLAMILANEGTYHQLHLVQYLEDPITNKKEWKSFNSKKISGISTGTYALLKQGMYRVVNGINGTAKLARCRDIKIAGKTGTAENPHGEPHAWFIGFAPFHNPEIAFCILVENGGSGGAVAAPIAR
ncbi:penicillin-binding protein 2, partial [Methanosarcinales archaeon]